MFVHVDTTQATRGDSDDFGAFFLQRHQNAPGMSVLATRQFNLFGEHSQSGLSGEAWGLGNLLSAVVFLTAVWNSLARPWHIGLLWAASARRLGNEIGTVALCRHFVL